MAEHLGDFGEEIPERDFTFGYFGETIRVHPNMNDLAVIDLFDKVAELDENDPRVAAVLKDTIREIVHPDDFELFWKTALAHRQSSIHVMALFEKLTEAVTDRPTQPPADSSGGRATTGTSSTAASSLPVREIVSRALATIPPEDLPPGRGDLQSIVASRIEQRAAAG